MRRHLLAYVLTSASALLFSAYCFGQSCAVLTHNPYTDFNSTPNYPTPSSIWVHIDTKLANTDLVNNGDFLLFSGGTITLNGISSTPAVTNVPIPNGKIVADNTVSTPITNYDMGSNTWTTRVPPGYSTSDIFISGAIITSSTGFKVGAGKSSVINGSFTSNRPSFSDSWFYGIGAYQPPFDYSAISAPGKVTAVGGGDKAGTPLPEKPFLVAGGSGGGGSNFTGSNSSTDNFKTCQNATCNLAASIQQTNVPCNGAADGSATVTLTGGTPPFTYSNTGGVFLQTSNAVSVFNGLAAATYNFTVTDGAGCSINQSVTITQPPALQISGLVVNASNNLSNGSITVTVTGGTPPYSFSWNTGANTENLSGLGAGTYTLTVTDANGCTAGLTEVLTGQVCTSLPVSATVVRGDFENSCDGEATINVTGGTPPYSYSWSDGVTTSTNTRNNLCGPPAGSGVPVQYTVVVTDASGCTGSTTFIIDVTSIAPSSMSESIQSANGMRFDPAGKLNSYVFPNPSRGLVHLQVNAQEKGNAVVNLVDMSGRVIKSMTVSLEKGVNTRDFQLPSHSGGLYMLQIVTRQETKTLPIRVY
jgi:hypothetical protein